MSKVTSLSFGPAPSPADVDKTVICYGSPRGGTSMVAGAMYGLGIDIGTDLPVNLEDYQFNMDKNDLTREEFVDSMIAAIDERNKTKGTWGWKYPSANRYLEDVLTHVRNPHLVLVFRDPIPASIRAGAPHQISTERAILQRLRAEIKNLRIAELCGAPAIAVSYEKAAQQPEVFLEEMAEFLGTGIPPNKDKIVDFMRPGKYKDPKMMFE
ncbi:hypothetical protein [Algirhabdus cladophorae]|uniref:hypothetical protein n=1 Tax=Algirhabdus cladophorae TaxID=3377108 RepID=UPI003B8495F8